GLNSPFSRIEPAYIFMHAKKKIRKRGNVPRETLKSGLVE
ncbi:unnamed protein product, partial [marine sediment metagenome]